MLFNPSSKKRELKNSVSWVKKKSSKHYWNKMAELMCLALYIGWVQGCSYPDPRSRCGSCMKLWICKEDFFHNNLVKNNKITLGQAGIALRGLEFTRFVLHSEHGDTRQCSTSRPAVLNILGDGGYIQQKHITWLKTRHGSLVVRVLVLLPGNLSSVLNPRAVSNL